MSKTKLNQITPADLVADFGVDGYRYHFLADVPFGPDNDFSYEGMVARYNSDLANNLGNLLSRVATVVEKKCDGVGPAPRPTARSRLSRRPRTDAGRVPAWASAPPTRRRRSRRRGELIGATNAESEATEPWKMAPGREVDGVHR